MRVHASDDQFWQGNFVLQTMMFREMTAVFNERKRLKMVSRSVPVSVSLSLGRTVTGRPGLTALHRAPVKPTLSAVGRRLKAGPTTWRDAQLQGQASVWLV